MGAACPQHRFLGRARLPGYRLAFTRRSVRTGTGVADAVVDPEGAVWGVLYEISDADLASLDRKEGAGWAYERVEVGLLTEDGTSVDALAYLVIEKLPEEVAPSPDYAQALLTAARDRGLPEAYVQTLPPGGPESD